MKAMTVVAALLCALPVAAKTLDVGLGAKYKTIDVALKATKPGDTVSVAAGFYRVPGGITITKDNVTLQGAGADRTILDGGDSADMVVFIYAKGVTVTGFTLQHGSSCGVDITGSNWGFINHNVITGNADCGILLGFGTLYAEIDHNTLVNNVKAAIYSYTDNPRTEITNNIVYLNGRAIMTDSTMSHINVLYNCFYGQSNDSEAASTSSTNLRADPMVVSPTRDFHVEDGSPCLGAGKDGTDIGALGKGKNPVAESPTAKGKGGK